MRGACGGQGRGRDDSDVLSVKYFTIVQKRSLSLISLKFHGALIEECGCNIFYSVILIRKDIHDIYVLSMYDILKLKFPSKVDVHEALTVGAGWQARGSQVVYIIFPSP